MKALKRILISATALFIAFSTTLASGCEMLEQLPILGDMLAHECESECPKCGACTNKECEKEECEEKCKGHEGKYWLTWETENVTVKLANGNKVPQEVAIGTEISFIVTEKSGYSNASVKANGVSLSSWNGVYTIVVSSDATFKISATQKKGDTSFEFTDATVILKEQTPYYLLKGTYENCTVAELGNIYFDMQNYKDFNSDYDWKTTEVEYDLFLQDNSFEMYVNLSEFPVGTCIIPHFNGTGGAGDIKVWTSHGTSVKVGEVVYTLDMNSTPYGVSAVTIVNPNASGSIPSDTTPPEINEIVNHDYFNTTELPRIDIKTANGIALDDPSLEDGWKVPNAVKAYDYTDAEVSVSNCEGHEMEDVAAEVKIRGNYTSTYAKKPIRIKFNKKQAMCGLNGNEKFKNWVLLAEYKDSSMLRNSVAFYLGNSLLNSDGFYCTDFRYVEVYLNGSYNGLYLLVEQQEVKDFRNELPEAIDPEDEPDNPNLKNPKIGYLVEFDGYYYTEKAEETFELTYNRLRYEDGTYVTPSQRGYTIKSDVYFEEQRAFIEKTMQNIWDIVYDATHKARTDLTKNPFYTLNANGEKVADYTIKTPREAVEKVIDVRSLVDVYILNEICQDMDLGWSSFYMAIDMSETGNRKLIFQAPWDFDSTLGSAAADNTKLFALNKMSHNSGNVGANPWLMVLSREAWFWTHVQAKWNALEKAGTFTGVLNMIDYFATNYVDVYAKNFNKWKECIGRKIEGQQIDLIATFKTQAQAAAYLKKWVGERIENLDALIDAKVGSFSK